MLADRSHTNLVPDVEIVDMAAEQGFAISIEDPIENPEQEW